MFIFILIVLLILFFPIYLKFIINFSDNVISIYFFKKNLITYDLKQKLILNKSPILNKFSSNKEKKTKSKDHTTKSSTKNKSSKPKLKISYFRLLELYTNSKFKPKLKFQGKANYSLDDAYYTAISYGAIANINTLIYILLTKFLNLKEYSLTITPTFSNRIEVNFSLTSIISFNIGQIINILILLLRSLRRWIII